MPEAFLRLSREDQLEALQTAAAASGRPPHILEKDVWVVWTLDALFTSPHAEHLVFKGGTSLSKAYKVIDRFSEDIDITYDVTRLVTGELAAAAVAKGAEQLPPNRSQGDKWRKVIEEGLPAWVQAEITPYLQDRITAAELEAKAENNGDKILIVHPPVAGAAAYMSPDVLVEFGGRSTGLPIDVKELVCDAAQHLPDLEFPVATVRVMHVERTFWEKATAVHAFCRTEKLPGDRLARHWYDLMRLDQTGHAQPALANRELAEQVVEHKSLFFRVTGVDYRDALQGGLLLAPETDFAQQLEADYVAMQDGGLLPEDAPAWSDVMACCKGLQDCANG